MKRFSKEVVVGRWKPGSAHAQLVLKIRDVVGSMAEVNKLAVGMGVDFKQLTAYSDEGKGYAVYNAFVELKDQKFTPEMVAAGLKRSKYVMEANVVAGRAGGIVDTLTFPVNWVGKRIVLMNQKGIADVFQDIQATFGTGGDVILFKSGTVYGKELEEYLVKTVGRQEMMRSFDYSLELLAATGWGVPEIVHSDPAELKGVLRLSRCFECEGRTFSRPMCSFVRGVLVGGAETLFGARFECEETSCAARGDEQCQFEFRAVLAEKPSHPKRT